ncbi:hypothetical protein [Actinokineospora pegani]|uniref:hypothetical protein n=1 Tax=Actinokineospora pegani TaxID=2654637 RepID=UPI0012EA3C15|nr:hypothetical protein [Actinokineospora pegani]
MILARALRAAARRAAEPGGLRFTERQLYYELCRVLRPYHLGPRRWDYTVRPPVSYSAFRAALAEAGPVPGLLPPAAPRRGTGLHTAEPDLFDYGLPRLLVCESVEVAGMLRANGIEVESACPVVAAVELPLDPRVVGMLELGGGTVYALHDATPAGMDFPAAAAAGAPVVALGLRPRQAWSLHLTRGRGPAGRPAAELSAVEGQWFAGGRFVEVEAVRPASLLRTVHRLVREVRPRRDGWASWTGWRRSGFLTWPRG